MHTPPGPKVCALAALLLLFGWFQGGVHSASAMGFGEEEPEARIPEPSISYRMVVRDGDLTEFDVVKASFDGHIYLTGHMGKAKVSIPFEKIRRVDFEPSDGPTLLAIVTLVNGQQQTLSVRGSTPCFGEAAFGNVKVELRHLKDVVIRGRALAP